MPASLAIACEALLSIGIAMAEDSALEREFRELLNTLVRLSHIGRVLRIGTAELVADVAHGVAEDEQRPRRIEHAYMTRCVPGGRDHAQAEHFVVITDRLKQPRRPRTPSPWRPPRVLRRRCQCDRDDSVSGSRGEPHPNLVQQYARWRS